jgi:hypothetical protein
MRTLLKLVLVVLFSGAARVVHAAGSAGTGMDFVTFLFLGFIALIAVFQLVPALVLFFSMLKGLFSTVGGKQLPRPVKDQSDR